MMVLTNINALTNVCKGDIALIKLSKEKNPTFHWSNLSLPKTRESCLHLAAQYGHTDVIRYLLTEFHPTVVDIRNIDNKTPLHDAAQFGQLECVKLLVQNGADINAIKRSDWTPLMLACTKSDKNYLDIVEYLLEKDAYLNFKNKDGWTPIHLAARNENSSILQLLLKCPKADVTVKTRNGRNALHISALHGNVDNVKLLISKLDPNSIDSSGNTPFHESVLSGNIQVIDYLVENGAEISVTNKTGANALHLAAGQNLEHVINLLVNVYNFDINCVDLNGYSALHWAARKNCNNAMKTLIKLGIDINILDKCGRLAKDYVLKKI
ncbi:hypothetical protein HHI36_021056 [Cryptolaemus montrouzieri]|uniref:Ankyrin repeat domain-containing protein 16 n=1 Tax=Cryptolaemus montrouzieri TaxID=559131 RepID=A0ABD2MWI3_9CUCU